MAEANNRLNVVLVLGGTQTLAWVSSYYLPAILADRMAADIGMTSGWFSPHSPQRSGSRHPSAPAWGAPSMPSADAGCWPPPTSSWRGTVPLAVFGPENYRYRLGLLGAPSRVAMAAAPLLFGLLIDRYGVGVLVVSSALSGVALAGLFLVPIPSRSSP